MTRIDDEADGWIDDEADRWIDDEADGWIDDVVDRWMSSSSDSLFYILLASRVLLPLRIGLLKLLLIGFKRKQVGTCK